MQAGQEVVTVNPVVVMGPGDLNVISGDFVLNIKRLQWTVPVPPGGVGRDRRARRGADADRRRRTRAGGERYMLGDGQLFLRRLVRADRGCGRASRPRFSAAALALPLLADLLMRCVAGLKLPVDGNQTGWARRLFFRLQQGLDELGTPQIDMRQSSRIPISGISNTATFALMRWRG